MKKIVHWMLVSVLGMLALTAMFPAVAREAENDELYEWQEQISREILWEGDKAMKSMLDGLQNQMQQQMKRQTRETLQRLGAEWRQRENRYTGEAVSAPRKGDMLEMVLPGPRSALVIEDGLLLMGDIR